MACSSEWIERQGFGGGVGARGWGGELHTTTATTKHTDPPLYYPPPPPSTHTHIHPPKHRQLLEWCRPGATLRQLHEQSVRLLAEGVSDLGLLPGRSAGAIAQGAIRAFYPHSVGHWLGLDTHDVPGVAHDTPLQPGVTLTVEPGLYIPDQERYGALAGIGVRIEDVVQINGALGSGWVEQGVRGVGRWVRTWAGTGRKGGLVHDAHRVGVGDCQVLDARTVDVGIDDCLSP